MTSLMQPEQKTMAVAMRTQVSEEEGRNHRVSEICKTRWICGHMWRQALPDRARSREFVTVKDSTAQHQRSLPFAVPEGVLGCSAGILHSCLGQPSLQHHKDIPGAHLTLLYQSS